MQQQVTCTRKSWLTAEDKPTFTAQIEIAENYRQTHTLTDHRSDSLEEFSGCFLKLKQL